MFISKKYAFPRSQKTHVKKRMLLLSFRSSTSLIESCILYPFKKVAEREQSLHIYFIN